jgi:hypothetical protein
VVLPPEQDLGQRGRKEQRDELSEQASWARAFAQCVLKAGDAMLATEVTLIGWQGRSVTKKSKASHLLEEEFVGFS